MHEITNEDLKLCLLIAYGKKAEWVEILRNGMGMLTVRFSDGMWHNFETLLEEMYLWLGRLKGQVGIEQVMAIYKERCCGDRS